MERERLKTFRIVAEHIGPSESPSNAEQVRNPKFDSVEFEEKNVDSLEEVVTSVEEVEADSQESKRSISNSQDAGLYGTYEDMEEQPKSGAESIEDPEFRNRRSQLSGIFLRDLYSGLYPKAGSIREKGLQKRYSYEIKDLSKYRSLSKTSSDITNSMVDGGKDNKRNQPDQNNTSTDTEDSIEQNSYTTHEGNGFDLSLNQSLNNPVTPQTENEISSEFKNGTKRASHPGLLDEKTKYIDLNEPGLNFSYEGKPGDDIVLRIDRQGTQFNNQSVKTGKDNTATELGIPTSTNKQETGTEIEEVEETNVGSGDNGSISNVVDGILKFSTNLINPNNNSEGHVKVREETGAATYHSENRDYVMYVVDKTKREVRCDYFIVQLLKSNMFVATLIFVLIVIIIVLILIIIYNVDMRSAKKQKYKKLRSDDWHPDKPGDRKNLKTSKSTWDKMNVFPSSKSFKRMVCIPSLTSDDDTASELERGMDKGYRKVAKEKHGSQIDRENNRTSKSSRQQKSHSSKPSIEKHKQGQDLKDTERKQKTLPRKVSFKKPKEGKEENNKRILKEQDHRQKSELSSKRSKEEKDADQQKPRKAFELNSQERMEKNKTSKEKIKSNRYSTHRYQSKGDGPILSYTRLTKKKAKDSCSSVECACTESYSSSKVKTSKSPSRNTHKASSKNNVDKVLDWMQFKVKSESSDNQSSSEYDVQDKVKGSNVPSKTTSSSMGTRIKDMILSPLKKSYNKTAGESDSDSSEEVIKKKKTKGLKKKSQTKNIDLESVLRDVELSSSPSRPSSKPTDLINKIVTTGESRKIDTMLTGQKWQRAVFYTKGMKTLDNGYESYDHQPGVKDMDENSEDKTLKQMSSSLTLQDEVGKSITAAEDKIKKVEHSPTFDPKSK